MPQGVVVALLSRIGGLGELGRSWGNSTIINLPENSENVHGETIHTGISDLPST